MHLSGDNAEESSGKIPELRLFFSSRNKFVQGFKGLVSRFRQHIVSAFSKLLQFHLAETGVALQPGQGLLELLVFYEIRKLCDCRPVRLRGGTCGCDRRDSKALYSRQILIMGKSMGAL